MGSDELVPPAPGGARLRVGVGVATMGRAEEVGQLIEALRAQTRAPSVIVVSGASPSDVADLSAGDDVELIFGHPGSCVQRNRVIDALQDRTDVIAFFDDDYLPSTRAIQAVGDFFARNPDVAGANGALLADGINSAGVSHDEARSLVAEYDAATPPPGRILHELDGLYGCNMAFRTAAIGEVRFDENLPLYGWQEDIDFSARLLPFGRIVKTDAFAGVHRGVKHGRSSGVRLGYSQIANPLYLARKGTMKPGYARRMLLRNLLANHWRVLSPEPWVDRRGRVWGNWLGLVDLVCGKLDPGRIRTL